jgi:hypothetical protein
VGTKRLLRRVARRRIRELSPTFRGASAALLAGAVLSIGACGESDSEKRVKAAFSDQHVYRTSRSAAAATLARLTAPEGFERLEHCPERDSVCFAKHRSLVPTAAELAHIVSVLGATLAPATAQCSRAKHPIVPRLILLPCTARATLGRELLLVNLTSVVVATPQATRSSTRHLRSGLGGSVVEVTDIGH